MTRPKCLVLGIGNLLLSDEGVGVHVVRALQDVELPGHVELLDGGTGGFHLLGCFQDFACLLIVDATLDEKPPGTVSVRQPRFASDFPRVLSSHDIGLRDLIESATLLGDLPRMFLITVSIAADQPMGLELSVPVRAVIEQVVQQVRTIVQDLVDPALQDPRSNLLLPSGNRNA
ncbi:MAG: hydrogenase maturation protease [Planctomycetota bacterium]|nr:hydrogenase maturation protease [Planctomycetota bacterium]